MHHYLTKHIMMSKLCHDVENYVMMSKVRHDVNKGIPSYSNYTQMHTYEWASWYGSHYMRHEVKYASWSKQEACRPDSSAISNWLSGHRQFPNIHLTFSSKSLIWPLRKWYLVIICPIFFMTNWPKVKSGQIRVGSNIAQTHSSSL